MTLVVEKPSHGPAHVADENIPGRALCGQNINVFYVIPQVSKRHYSRCPDCQARAAALAAEPRTEATV
jgi:hypothetical protein